MDSHETEQAHNSPLSPKVVRGFIDACAYISRYGEYVMAKQFIPSELNVVNDQLTIINRADGKGATHQASGKIIVSPFDATVYQAEVWTPLESVAPRKVIILGEVVTLKTVIKDSIIESGPFANPEKITQFITTSENRMFQIDSNIDTPDVHSIHEFDDDWDLESYTDILKVFANELHEAYPNVAKKYPKL